MIKIIAIMLKPELLAPAGDWKSFIAAVEAGADAVYFGGKDFSARSFAINLSRGEIKKAVDYAHLRGVKCYAAVNTLIKDNEFPSIFDYINFLYAEGIDALIIQDLGVLNLCQKYWPDLPLHASTQIGAHNLNDVLELEKMGFKRAVLARELTLGEIKEIKNKTKIEIECFVHGALCFSYSGQCFFSSVIGGRSGNRGKCAQPCRKKYALTDAKTGESRNIEGYLLSTKDLCALDILDKIQFADSLKIEGRMKGAAYVWGVMEKYRKAIDSLARNEKISPEELEADKKELALIFNRGGFSRGYLLEKKPGDLISPDRSKNFGVPAGEVIEARRGAIKIRTKGVGVNDGLEIWGRGGQEKNIGFRVEKMSGDIINIFIEGDVRAGDKVYKNYDYKLNKRLESFARENYQKKLPIKMIFKAQEEKNITLEIYSRLFEKESGNILKNSLVLVDEISKKAVVKLEGAKAESAVKIQTGENTIREQLAKLGATPFFAEKINIEINGDIYIPLKDLNNLRRDAAEELEKEIINSFKRKEKRDRPPDLAVLAAKKKNVLAKKINKIAVQSNNLAVLDALADKKISRIYTELKINTGKFHKNNIEVYQALPRILRKGEKLEIFAEYDGFLAPALGYLEILPPQAKKAADFSLNIFNNYSVRELKKLGFSAFTASVENTLKEINSLHAEKMEKEAIVYGYLPLMVAEHCVLCRTEYCLPRFASPGSAKRAGGEAGKKKIFSISDEKKIAFPLLTDCASCRMQVLNSLPLYFTDVGNLEADNIRLMHTVESSEKFLKIVDNYLSGDFGSVENATTGHFYRGAE